MRTIREGRLGGLTGAWSRRGEGSSARFIKRPHTRRDALTLHRSSFVSALRAEFPGIEPWLAGYRENLTFEMMRFRQFTEDAIERGDVATARKSFAFLHRAFETGNRHVRNSVVVSFLEHLEFSGSNGKAAEQLLPKDLAEERGRMLATLRQLEERPRKRSPRTA